MAIVMDKVVSAVESGSDRCDQKPQSIFVLGHSDIISSQKYIS
jgi:hypothetical protein